MREGILSGGVPWKGFATGFGVWRHFGASGVGEVLSDWVTHGYRYKSMDLYTKNRCLSGAANLKAVISH